MEQNDTFCSNLTSAGSFAAIADMTWGGWDAAKLMSAEYGIPYIRIEVKEYTNHSHILLLSEALETIPF